MGKKIIFECDQCGKEYHSSNQVLILDGIIYNGNDEIIYKDNKKKIICQSCISKICSCDTIDNEECVIPQDEVDEQELDLADKTVLRKIENIKDEDTFITYLGHITREQFQKSFNKSLIGMYYPTEEEIGDININSCCNRNLSVIYKVFAGIPQIKEIECIVYKDKALANKKDLDG
jgi:hypothetical protein